MAITYEPIATTTLSTATATVTFSSISGSYTDLILVVQAANSSASTNWALALRFNSDTGSNYSRTYMVGDGSSAASANTSNATSFNGIVTLANNVLNSAHIAQIQNYSNTTANKTILTRSNTTAATYAFVGLWRNTAAITQIDCFIESAGVNISSGSTFTLYGVLAA